MSLKKTYTVLSSYKGMIAAAILLISTPHIGHAQDTDYGFSSFGQDSGDADNFGRQDNSAPLTTDSGASFDPPGETAAPQMPLPTANTAMPSNPAANPANNPGMNLPFGAGEATGQFAPPALNMNELSQPVDLEAEIREEAFKAAITGLLPMNPDEIRKLLERFDETQEAVEVPIYPYPEPTVAVETVSLDPGATPPVVNVAVGHVATLNVVDITGAPWPIQDISWAGNFEIVQPEEGGHVIRITPLSEFAYGNMSFRLLDLKTPVTFTIRASRDKVHYRFDARIPEYGPFANAPLIQGGVTISAGKNSNSLGQFLDGTPPFSAERMDVTGVDGRTTAYKLDSQTYIRTPLTLLSPGWENSVSSADGMKVYVLSNAPVVLLSDRGQVVRAHLKEAELTYE